MDKHVYSRLSLGVCEWILYATHFNVERSLLGYCRDCLSTHIHRENVVGFIVCIRMDRNHCNIPFFNISLMTDVFTVFSCTNRSSTYTVPDTSLHTHFLSKFRLCFYYFLGCGLILKTKYKII